ncbi:caspase-8-like [Leptodactylus fuscus]|uniref:caspase-8-like n=1 Tax=Leptodactylus fuscus TaxID=238119 RepID=UPI003F4E4D5F
MNAFLVQLHEITSDLDSSNLSELTFLCKDLIPQQPSKGKQDIDLLKMLMQMSHIDENNTSLIEELLFHLKRYDLLSKHFKLTSKTVAERLNNPTTAHISPYRCLLYNLGNLVPDSKVTEIKSQYNGIISKPRLEKVTSLWDLFIELERKDKISKDNVSFLTQMSQYVDDDKFMELITTYEKEIAAAAPGSINTDDSHGEPTSTTQESELSGTVYTMNSPTRGICLIINNFDFSEARCNPGQEDFKDRRGTKIDEESLQDVFSKLGFQVEIKNDLKGYEMLQTIKLYSEINHEQNNCFICCVLSHGDQGIIYGTDGESVPIRNLTLSFSRSRCSTLTGKPKLFFIQACQGKKHHQLVPLQTDACNASADCCNISKNLIPDEPDFLLGMPTTLQCVSFRDPICGSWYIQSLCKQLHQSYQSKKDIISTLTKVNQELSRKQAGNFSATQMPEPWTTLTKKLVF